jgi:Asp-tRNA(Asn)/Glu-tRNA(Gln) amidotransferase A subunit family amidase
LSCNSSEPSLLLRTARLTQGAPVGCGIPALLSLDQPAPASAPCVAALQAAGAHVSAHCSTQPLNSPALGDNLRNPASPWRAAGGGATGAAAAVARAEADVGVGSELLGTVHAPAACMGLCSFFPTPGALAGWEAGAGASELTGACLASSSAHTLGPTSLLSAAKEGPRPAICSCAPVFASAPPAAKPHPLRPVAPNPFRRAP